VTALAEHVVAGTHVASARLGDRADAVVGYGRAAERGTARRIAILEAWERWASLRPREVPVVRGSYWDLRATAIDPRTLGSHGPDALLRPGFGLSRFSSSRDYDWVWAYSFQRDERVLVPVDVAYYGLNRPSARHRCFVYETSNGCAVGGCREEAVLHGLLEVAERDAFLLTWYGRRSVPELVGTTAGVTLLDITTVEQRVPCVLAIARSPDGPAFACATAAHPASVSAAAEHAVTELGPFAADLAVRYRRHRDTARAMAENPDLVRRMGDHALAYADPVAAARTAFLFETATDGIQSDPIATDDLRDDVLAMVERYTSVGLDVLVVDQTTAELRERELACVKVIVPGTLPMTFGHAYRRVHGLPRLAAHANGGPINPWPHPFP
jgi:ribosomal protein S12 methylthiotransferase accessory factor